MLSGLDAYDVGVVVLVLVVIALLDGGHDLVSDDDGLGELLAAVDHAVTDRVDLLHGADDAVLLVHKGVQNSRDGFVVGGHGDVGGLDGLLALELGLVGELAVDADALAQALAQHAFALHIDELKLQRAGTSVDDQIFHPIFPPIHKKAQLCFLKSLHYYIMIIKHFQAHGRKRARKSEKNGQDSQFMRAQRPKEARQP